MGHQVFAILRVEKDGMKISAGVRSLARSTQQNAQTHISAEQSKARQETWLSRAHEVKGWTGGIVATPRPGPSQADGQRRKSCPHCQSQLVPTPAARPRPRSNFRKPRRSCDPPIFERSMTKVSVYPVHCSRRSAWHAIPRSTRCLPVPGSASQPRVRWAEPWCAIASSGGFERPFDCTEPI